MTRKIPYTPGVLKLVGDTGIEDEPPPRSGGLVDRAQWLDEERKRAATGDDLDDTLPDPDREFGAERDLGSLVPLPASVIRASGVPEGEARFRHDHAALDNSGSDRVEGAQTAVPLSPGRVDRHHVAGRGLLKADVLR